MNHGTARTFIIHSHASCHRQPTASWLARRMAPNLHKKVNSGEMVIIFSRVRCSPPSFSCSTSSSSSASSFNIKIVHTLLLALLCAHVMPLASSSGLNSIEDLREFFKSTYIRKQVGQIFQDPKNDEKLYYAEMFNPLW